MYLSYLSNFHIGIVIVMYCKISSQSFCFSTEEWPTLALVSRNKFVWLVLEYMKWFLNHSEIFVSISNTLQVLKFPLEIILIENSRSCFLFKGDHGKPKWYMSSIVSVSTSVDRAGELSECCDVQSYIERRRRSGHYPGPTPVQTPAPTPAPANRAWKVHSTSHGGTVSVTRSILATRSRNW